MKYLAAGFISIFATAALLGCVKNSRDDCDTPAERNLVLHFEYFDQEENDIFAERIEMVDVVIFDEQFNFYNWVYLSKQNLDEFRGVRLEVEPGDYHLICWANLSSSRDEIPDDQSASLGQSVIHHNNRATADPLHFAPDRRSLPLGRATRSGSLTDEGTWLLSVPATGAKEDTVAFMSAHRTVNVYLQNFPGMDDPEPVYPDVAIENLSEYYSFTLGRSPKNAYFLQQPEEITVEGERYCYVKFYIPHFDGDNDINVVISEPGQDVLETVTMEKILELNEIEELYDGDDIVLDLALVWGDSLVEVTLPKFKTEEIKPEF